VHDGEAPGLVDAVVFDLGGVLIDWDARYLYRSLLSDPAAVDAFLAEIGFDDWNRTLDAGRDWDEAVEWLANRHPHRRALIEAFRDRWEETLGTAMEATVAVLRELRAHTIRVFALSNWSRRTFDVAASHFEFLEWFEAVVISGDVGATKPDERIFRRLLEDHGLSASSAVFVDDVEENVRAAEGLGMAGIRFENAAQLRGALFDLGLPVARDS